MNLILIGLRGVGKSYYGRLLSKSFGLHLIDTDELIEKKVGLKISEIVEKYGWDEFRSIEKDVTEDLLSTKDSLISTGGGLPCYFDNAKKLKKIGKIIWLKASIDYMIKMISKSGDSKRPSITGKGTYEEIEDLMNVRYPIFESIADLVINVDEVEGKDVVNKVEKLAERTGFEPAVPCETTR